MFNQCDGFAMDARKTLKLPHVTVNVEPSAVGGHVVVLYSKQPDELDVALRADPRTAALGFAIRVVDAHK